MLHYWRNSLCGCTLGNWWGRCEVPVRPTVHRTLTPDNLRAALLASGSIPLLMEGVRIPGAPGVYRDGGSADYHLDLDYGPGPGAEPMRRWQTIPDASAALGDELHDLIETGRLVDAVVPWA